MELIRKIEIAYFRSIYKETLSDLKGTNIVFGRNDAGKSNVLRALNLFFNNATNPNQAFRFDRDFCHSRLAEATPERDVRKFVYVKIWFNTPKSWKASLGENFWVKKQWSITRESDPHFESSITEKRLQQYLTRFLNKVRFYYIPAIKDRGIFEYLLGEIYKVIASHAEFSESLGAFSQALRDRTGELSTNLQNGLGINSVISPPDDLTDLFRSLDFETNSEQGDSYSLTLQRGDGIQVRHIPEILAFLSEKSSEDYHLWGFEEPENSLELASAIEEAETFCKYGSEQSKQIFLTSHSPAFFALDDEHTARFFVSRSEDHGDRKTSKIVPILTDSEQPPSELMGETPHLSIISSYLKDAHQHIQKLKDEGSRLADEVAGYARSVVFVEGRSDALILSAAWKLRFKVEPPFDIEAAGGTTKMESLGRDGRILSRLSPERLLFVVIDNDRAGRTVYKNGRLDSGGTWVMHNSNSVRWCRLPFTNAFKAFMKKNKIPEDAWPGCLENLFSPEKRQEAVDKGILKLKKTPHDEFLDSAVYPKILGYLNQELLDSHWILNIEDDCKISFAEWIVEQSEEDPELLAPLFPVVSGIYEALIGPVSE